MIDPQSHYKPGYVKIARELCATFGAYNAELAKVLGVTPRTLTKWRQQHPEFGAAIDAGKQAFDTEHVLGAMIRSALGCQCKKCLAGKPPVGHARPNAISCIFIMKNRHPDEWKDRTETNVSGGLALNYTLEKTYEPGPRPA